LTACGSTGTSSSASGTVQSQHVTIHVGYFPNLTHTAALVGVAQGTLAKSLGSNVTLTTTTFNAGPSLIEALFGGSIDIGYVGPSPAVNGYIKSNGAALRIIAGASSGGASFIVRPEANIASPQDLANKKLATPQLGGTQDVALRYYLQQHDLHAADQGGNVQIVPTDNGTILSLFKQGKIDGAWVPEPWATRLVVEDQGKIFVDERTLWPANKFATTIVVVRKAFRDQYPDLVKKFLHGHISTIQSIQAHPSQALTTANAEIKRITGQKSLPEDELNQAFSELEVTYDPLVKTVNQQAERAYTLGFIKGKPQLSGLYDLEPLNTILTSQGLAPVATS
jgi:NitT/TauT family transport system substrate-binding protein